MLDCLVDGELSGHIPVSDRGLQYGDGVFETLAVFSGTPRFWQGHMDRLVTGCERLGLSATPQEILLREVRTVSAGRSRCVVKIILTRGDSGRGYTPEAPPRTRRAVLSYAWPADPGHLEQTGIRTRICDLRLGLQPALSGIKHLNRLEQVMARSEWSDPAIHEGVLLDPEDHVISGIASNIFLVHSGRLLTPRLDRCGVRGVMRSAILSAFRERCEQRRITVDMLPEAEEVFLCNAVRGIFPIRQIDQWEYAIGPVTREVQTWLAAL